MLPEEPCLPWGVWDEIHGVKERHFHASFRIVTAALPLHETGAPNPANPRGFRATPPDLRR